MSATPKLILVSLLSISALSACAVPDDCLEPEAPFVLPEGVYEKYGDPNIVAREACTAPPVRKFVGLPQPDGASGVTRTQNTEAKPVEPVVPDTPIGGETPPEKVDDDHHKGRDKHRGDRRESRDDDHGYDDNRNREREYDRKDRNHDRWK